MRLKNIKISITQKVFLYLFTVCILPILFFGVFAYNSTNNIFKDEVNKFTYDLIYSKQKNLELVMQNIESLIINLSSLDDIGSILTEDFSDDSYSGLSAQAKIGYILSGYSNLKGLVSIDIFSNKGNHYHVGETLNFKDINIDLQRRIFGEAMASQSLVTWNGIEDNININSKQLKVITASRVVKVIDSSNMVEKTVGLIVVNYDIGAFTESIKGNTFKDAVFMVVDGKNRIIHDSKKNRTGYRFNSDLIKNLDKNSGSFKESIDGEEMIVTYIKSQKSGWYTIGMIPLKVFNSKTFPIVGNVLLLICVSFLVIILFIVFISNKYISPVKKITDLFKQFKDGSVDSKIRLQKSSNDELGELITWFNAFLKGMDEKKVMEHEILTRERVLKGIAEATHILIGETEHHNAFNKALEVIGRVIQVDRAYIFENHADEVTGEILMSQRYEWCREGITPQIDNDELKGLHYNRFSNWHNKLSADKAISMRTGELPQDEQEIFISQGILSILIVPIFVNNMLWGFIGFDDCTYGRLWSKSEEDTLKIAAASIGGAFKRLQNEEAIQRLIKDDFRNTVKNLQNLVFKVKRNASEKHIFTLFEGKMAKELGLDSEKITGKSYEEWIDRNKFGALFEGLEKASNGEINNFELDLKDKTLYVSLSPVADEFSNEVVGSAIDITELKKAEEKIRHMAYYDNLTGLPNLMLFSELLNSAIHNAGSNGNIIAIMLLDLDQFKLINDSLGHAVGDALLYEVAGRLKSFVNSNCVISRMSGDKFTVLLTEIKDEFHASMLAQKLIQRINSSFMINGYELFITTSIGISMYPYHGNNVEILLKNADLAIYKAKSEGRNNYQFYTLDMERHAMKRLSMETRLRKAIELNEFLIYYQPKIDIKTEKIVGCEALIRWAHPELGMISPGEFIPIAEESGLIVPLGELVMKSACTQVKKWHDQGVDDLKVSVNISAKQFQHQNIIENVTKILDETGLEPEFLELEVTEYCIMQNTERTVDIINKLKSIGVEISIDDFGTGFSSMAYLKRFAADKLKIDRSFIQDINAGSSDTAIVSAIINMAHSLNMKVVAEGVENLEQFYILEQLNCNEVQGYLFSKPLKSESFEEYMQSLAAVTIA